MKREHLTAISVHLAATWTVGSAIVFGLGPLLLATLWAGRNAILLGATALAILLSALLMAALGHAARTVQPLTSTRRGLLGWTASVYTFGTAGAATLIFVMALSWEGPFGAHITAALCLLLGFPYAVTAAFLLPNKALRWTTLAVAAVTLASAWYTARQANRPLTDQEWLAEARTPAALLRVGDAPGYALRSSAATDTSYAALYTRPGHQPLTLRISRTDSEGNSATTPNCYGTIAQTMHCTDDGAGRTLVTYLAPTTHKPEALRELRLRRDGLVLTVQFRTPEDLTTARHILTTLHRITPDALPPRLAPCPSATPC
ncbi:hypothetical protein [Streptomyces sp. NPDC101150]|uniref:hypothetical protein n=1 Tax=Streptomyces sp. NPDC101150 TaxID=3366114 RepID=UPI0038178595